MRRAVGFARVRRALAGAAGLQAVRQTTSLEVTATVAHVRRTFAMTARAPCIVRRTLAGTAGFAHTGTMRALLHFPFHTLALMIHAHPFHIPSHALTVLFKLNSLHFKVKLSELEFEVHALDFKMHFFKFCFTVIIMLFVMSFIVMVIVVPTPVMTPFVMAIVIIMVTSMPPISFVMPALLVMIAFHLLSRSLPLGPGIHLGKLAFLDGMLQLFSVLSQLGMRITVIMPILVPMPTMAPILFVMTTMAITLFMVSLLLLAGGGHPLRPGILLGKFSVLDGLLQFRTVIPKIRVPMMFGKQSRRECKQPDKGQRQVQF